MNGDGYDPARRGCTGCGRRHTVVVDGVHGRRCAACAPPSAAHLVDAWPPALTERVVDASPRLAWLRVYLPRLLGGAR